MSYKINSVLPIKYDLMVHTAMPNYPTHSDFIFDVCAYFVRVYSSKNKELAITDLKFSAKTLKYIFGDQINDEQFRQKIKKIVADLLEDESLSKKGEFIFILETTFTKYFSIV
jgi:hypothetical protein